jgi:hypothetical protein
MSITYKVLGQSAPSANTDANLYTVPSATSAVVSTLSICNRDSVATKYRVAVRPAGASISNEHYVVYDSTVGIRDTVFLTLGVSLAATDVITVRAESANVSFSVFGSEISS